MEPFAAPAVSGIAMQDGATLAATACLLARALEDDPAYAYLLPDLAQRACGLADFFTQNLRAHLAHDCTRVVRDPSGAPCATVTLRPPGGIHISMATMIRRGLLPFALAHGAGAVRRLSWLKRTYDGLEQSAARGGVHRHVHMMAVRPELQGRGEGGRLLAHVLAATDASGPEAPTVLTTHRERNVVFYRRAGFEVVDERWLYPPGGTAYVVWSMTRG